MTLQETRSLAFLIANTLATAGYSLAMAALYGAQLAANPDQPALWSGIILGWVPLQVVIRILVMIVLAVINQARGGGENLELEDELDRLIDLKSVRVICSVFTAGFMLALGSQAIGQPLHLLFVIFAATMALCGLAGDAVVLGLYRRGC